MQESCRPSDQMEATEQKKEHHTHGLLVDVALHSNNA